METTTINKKRANSKMKTNTKESPSKIKRPLMEKNQIVEPKDLMHLSDKAIRDYKLVRKAREQGDQHVLPS